MIAGADKLKSLSDEQKPTVAIITNLLCEKLAVDSLIERKTTYIRYKTEGKPLLPRSRVSFSSWWPTFDTVKPKQ